MRALLRSRFTWLASLALVVCFASLVFAVLLEKDTNLKDLYNRDLHKALVSRQATNLQDLADGFLIDQSFYLWFSPRHPDFVLFQPGGTIPVLDLKAFPDAFVEGLVGIEEDGIHKFPVWMYEDVVGPSREIVIENMEGKEIARIQREEDYTAEWFALEYYPDLDTYGQDAKDWILSCYEPARIAMRYDLIIGEDDLIKYVWAKSVAAVGGGLMKGSWEGGSVTNFKFVAADPLTNGTVELTIAWPTNGLSTNMVDFFGCTNLLAPDWGIVLTTNVDLNTNCFSWIDSGAASCTTRFYDCWTLDDTDGDGLSDGRERRIYGTDTDDADTDDDDLSDGEEVNIYGTDPNDPNDPPDISGTVFYEGGQTGSIWVVAVTVSNSWATNLSCELAGPGEYEIEHLPKTNYWIKAYRDNDGNGELTGTEAWGVYSNSPIIITASFANIDIFLEDPDDDADSLPDWWETLYFGSLTNQDAGGNPDGDAWTNYFEYIHGLSPVAVDTETGDADGDGYMNIYEIQHGTHCGKASDYPLPTVIVTNGGALSIQQAIDLATNDYDIVMVLPGTYIAAGDKNLDFGGKKIMVTSQSGAASTIIDCQDSGRGFYFHSGEGRESVVRGITIRNGSADFGGGVMCDGGSPSIMSCDVVNNSASSSGGGICAYACSGPQIEGCTVSENNATICGGGIYCVQVSDALVSDSGVYNNEALNGGGFGSWDATCLVARCVIQDNEITHTYAAGGGVFAAGSSARVRVENCGIRGNQAIHWGAGVASLGNANVDVLNCTIIDNSGAPSVGGIFCTGKVSRPASSWSWWETKSSTVSSAGSGAFAARDGTLTATNSIIWDNEGGQMKEFLGGSIETAYCDIQGGYAGTGNINSDPLLTEDMFLQDGSPCKDAGVANAPAEDINGEGRPSGEGFDMGWDEFIDIDEDHLPDWWEEEYFGGATNALAEIDSDGDCLTNLLEYVCSTDPTSNTDTDGDTLSDDLEQWLGTDPEYWDSDDDTMSDAWEWEYGFDPTSSNDPSANSDGDGWTDGQEADQGTNPNLSDTDGDGTDDDQDIDPLDDAYNDTADSTNTTWMTLLVGDSSGSHTELYAMKVGPYYLHMSYVSAGEYIFTKTVRVPRGREYEGYVESLADDDDDGDYDADLSGDGVIIDDPDGVLGGHKENSGFNSGKRYFHVRTLKDEYDTEANSDPARACTEEPINTINGNVTVTETDIILPCPGLNMIFRRDYNSRSVVTNSPFGHGWNHSFNWFLTSKPDTLYKGLTGDWVVAYSPEGREHWFKDSGNGTFDSPSDNALELSSQGGLYYLDFPGGEQTWKFDGNGVLQTLSDGFDNTLTLTYDGTYPNQQLDRIDHSNGQSLDVSWQSNLISRVDSPSNTFYVTFAYSAQQELTNTTRTIAGETQTTRYLYDEFHSLTQRVNAVGDAFNYTYEYAVDGSGQTNARGVSMVLDADYYQHTVNYTNQGNNRTEVTYTRGNTNQTYIYEYESITRKITAQYGPGGTNLGVTYGLNAALDTTETTVFDGQEYLKAVRSYDGKHNVKTEAFGYNFTPTNDWWQYTWHEDNQTLTSIQDPEGHRMEFDYTNGLVKESRLYYATNQYCSTMYSYATNGLLSEVQNANGNSISFTYDQYGYLSTVEPDIGPTMTFDHSRLGHLQSITLPGSGGARVTSFDADELGRIKQITYPNSLNETFAYDPLGNLTNHVDTAGRVTRYTYLPTRKLSSIVREFSGGSAVTNSFVYDNQFNALTIRDALDREVETYVLDIQDRPVTVSNVESQTMSVTYGVAGIVKSVERFDGAVVSNSYDSLAWLTGVTWPDASTTFTYYDNALLKTVTSEAGTVSNTYDQANRLTSVASACEAVCWVVDYFLDGIGNATNVVVSVDDSAILTNAYTFDAAERISQIGGAGGSFAFSYGAYNGLVAEVSNATSGIRAEYTYDDLDRLTNIVWRNSTNGILHSFAYQYNNAGMITNVARETGGWTAYEYDGLDRLTSETVHASGGAVSNAYSWKYDLAGNRTQAVVNAATVSYALGVGNRLASFGVSGTVLHDDAGNITNIVYNDGRKLDLEWNSRYQLVSVYTNGVPAESYTYGPLGRRVSISDGVTTNWLVYDGPHIVAEVDEDGDLVRSYCYGSGIDNLLSMTVHTGAVAKTYYALTDHLGTIYAWADESGDIVERYRYDAWGRVLGVYDSNGTPLSESAIGNRYLWQGREYSFKTGLYFFRSRYYDPITGRWLSKDIIGIAGGLNQYEFCGSNPINFVDPLGLWEWDNDWIELGIGGILGFHGREVAGAGWSQLDEGIAATADGFIPFFDPFENYYADECGNVDSIYKGSRHFGGISRDLLLASAIPNIGAWTKNPVMYEIGQKTLPRGVYRGLKGLSAIERGKGLVQAQGLLRALRPELTGQYVNTVRTGFTPGGWLLNLVAFEGVDYQTRK